MQEGNLNIFVANVEFSFKMQPSQVLMYIFLYFHNVFKEFACNGTVVEHSEYGEVLQLQGDQRHKICGWLTQTKLVKADQLKVHGF